MGLPRYSLTMGQNVTFTTNKSKMRISKIQLVNFKRFTDLVIENIPDSAKLVLLIGSNGSGKSSVFDAFEYLSRQSKRGNILDDKQYYAKNQSQDFSVSVTLTDGNTLVAETKKHPGNPLAKKFYGRSSLRIEPRIQRTGTTGVIENDTDAPERYIDMDRRFHQDVFEYTKKINELLREPVFRGQQADTVKIFETYIQPLNDSLHHIFGLSPYSELQITRFEEQYNQAPRLYFKKGEIPDLSYDLLSHGEKQVIILLLNFIVRREAHKDSIYFIDEMDVHLNTKLQYKLIKEIAENWIPENSQLWTATHALGFIEYANDVENGIIADFNDLDYDKVQVLKPADKTNYPIFELAVSREFIDKIFKGRTIVFSENTDTPLYNDLSLDNTFFFTAIDKADIFHKSKNLKTHGLIDRDYLTDDEVRLIQQVYPEIKILPYYSIENLLYHPSNLAEYFAANKKEFNIDEYKTTLINEKDADRDYIAAGILQARSGYPFFKENEQAPKLKAFKDNWRAIVEMLRTSDFETFYKIFPAKDYGKSIEARKNLNRKELAKTKWFRAQIETIFEP